MARREASNAEKDQHAAERREQLEQWQSRLAEQVTDLVNGDQWQRWLEVASRFHRYSFRNSVMILIQCEDATAVAGYQAWKTLFGRQVNRGETGIRILAPVTKRFDKVTPDGRPVLDEKGRPDSGTRLVGVRLATVFDISQTSGPDLPAQPLPTLLTGEAPAGLWDGLKGFVEEQGFRVTRGDCGGANGITDFTTGEVRVRADIDDAAAVKTLAHEAGHCVLHGPEGRDGQPVCRGRGEVEAESVAYLLTRAHGLDSGQYTFTYVAGWAEQAQKAAPPGTSLADIVSATGSRVIHAADTILAATQPPSVIDQLIDEMATQVPRAVTHDHAHALAAHASTRPAYQHPKPLPTPAMARTASAPAR